jgi:homoserine kinase type II
MPPSEPNIFAQLCKVYGLSALQQITPLRPGTAAQVWRLTTDKGDFLLRTLTGPRQGRREWTVYQHLTRRGFQDTPDLLTTPDGAPMAELDGVWYQLQRYCPGEMPDPAQPGAARSVAALAVRLTQALSHCPALNGEDDFDLASVWSSHRENWPRLMLPLSQSEADRAVAELASLPVRAEQVIHGDLGPWNLLCQENGTMLVVDFGQARLGDPYFDLATALAGLVNHAPDSLKRQVAEEFLTECRRLIPLDLPRLVGQLRLWAWQGLTQCVQAIDQGSEFWKQMAPRFYSALCWAEENL